MPIATAISAAGSSCTASSWAAEGHEARIASVTSALLASDDRAALRAKLREVVEECSQANWDGHGAIPIGSESFAAAWRFINALPNGFKMPEVSADPDGCVTFEWRRGPRRILLVSVHPNYRVDYAALIGASRLHGDEPVFDELPSGLASLLEQLYAV